MSLFMKCLGSYLLPDGQFFPCYYSYVPQDGVVWQNNLTNHDSHGTNKDDTNIYKIVM